MSDITILDATDPDELASELDAYSHEYARKTGNYWMAGTFSASADWLRHQAERIESLQSQLAEAESRLKNMTEARDLFKRRAISAEQVEKWAYAGRLIEEHPHVKALVDAAKSVSQWSEYQDTNGLTELREALRQPEQEQG